MKRVGFAILAIAALLGYRYYASSHSAEKQYQAFAEAVLHRRYDEAAAMTLGLSKEDVARAGTQEKIGAGPAMFQTLFPSTFKIGSKETTNGTVTLRAVQTVLFNPAGVESALRPAMYARMNQVVTLRKSDGDWKVTSFENKFETMDSAGR